MHSTHMPVEEMIAVLKARLDDAMELIELQSGWPGKARWLPLSTRRADGNSMDFASRWSKRRSTSTGTLPATPRTSKMTPNHL